MIIGWLARALYLYQISAARCLFIKHRHKRTHAASVLIARIRMKPTAFRVKQRAAISS